jgi:WD40 repeat protein
MRFRFVIICLATVCLLTIDLSFTAAREKSGTRYEVIVRLKIPHASQAEWSPDGSRLAVTAFPTIQIWDTTRWELLLTIHDAPAYSNKWSPDGKKLAGVHGGDETVLVWDAATGKILNKMIRLRPSNMRGTLILHDLAWHPDGKRLVTDSGQLDIDMLLIWDLAANNNPQPLAKIKPDISEDEWMNIATLNWSHNGQWLLSDGGDGNFRSRSIIRIWNANTGEAVRTIFPGFHPVWGPNDTQFAGLTISKDRYVINIWELKTGKVQSTFEAHENGTFALSWNHTANVIAGVALKDHLILWNVETGLQYDFEEVQTTLPGNIVWKPNSNQLAIADHEGVVILNFEFGN